jgi:hypothetical protein
MVLGVSKQQKTKPKETWMDSFYIFFGNINILVDIIWFITFSVLSKRKGVKCDDKLTNLKNNINCKIKVKK